MRELVALKYQGHWDIVWDIHLSEGKNLTDPQEVISILSENFLLLADGTYDIEEDLIYCNLDQEIVEAINSGTNK